MKVRPSDTKKEYPVDIAVFTGADHVDDAAYIIIECKKKNRKDGRSQLEDYLRFSKAYLGVWFNGEERLYLQKIEKDGRILFEEIPNIPRYSERVEDIGKFKRKDLKPAENLKPTFKTIRNYLAANAVGITRDEVFASQLINIIFCKIYDERFTRPNDTVSFRAGLNEKDEDVYARVLELFEKVKRQYNDVIDVADSIQLDPRCVKYIVGELQLYSLKDSSRDAVGEAFEIFIGPSLKGAQGQFFTPRNVVNMVVNMIDPDTDEKILDPACGSGGFLVESLRYVWSKLEKNAQELGWPEAEIEAEKQKIAIKNFRGIDKDAEKEDVLAGDILFVRDGTYLVGTSCMVTECDEKMLFCGGLYKIRTNDKEYLDEYLLLGLLNSYIVKRQVRTKQFTRDVIDTLGKRIEEVVLPIPKNAEIKKEISRRVRTIIDYRISAREIITALSETVYG